MDEITFADFEKVEMRVGTVLQVEPNPKARKPAYVLKVDFGEYGIKTSSAQITRHYTPEELIGTQIVAVLNFPPKRIAGIKSEILILGSVSDEEGVILLRPTLSAPNGSRIA